MMLANSSLVGFCCYGDNHETDLSLQDGISVTNLLVCWTERGLQR